MLILPNKNTMIIIKLSSKIKHITENQYKKIIQSLNFDELAKKQLEKIIIDFRSSTVAEMSPFANTLTNWEKDHQQLYNCGWQIKQEDEHCHRRKQKQVHQAPRTCLKRLSKLEEILQSHPLYIKLGYNLLLHKHQKGW